MSPGLESLGRAALAVLLAGACLPVFAADPVPADVKILITPPGALQPGSRGETKFLLSPPEGIHINRFPAVAIRLTAPGGIVLDRAEVRMGSEQPIDDPEEFPFKTIEPMTVAFKVDPAVKPGTYPVTGKMKFVTCVVKSGYCAPNTRDVSFDVTVAPPRTN
jgi:hypothetical protein